MANKTIYLLGTVKTNKNGTNYVDVAEGRVFLGKSSGFKAGDQIMGDAIVSDREVTYPATAAVGVPGAVGYRPAQVERTDKGFQVENFISEELITKKLEADARKAKAQFNIAVTQRQTNEIAAMDTAELFSMVS